MPNYLPYSDPMFMAPYFQGQAAAQNLSSQLNNAFAFTNSLNSANRQASYGPEASMANVQAQEQGKTARMNAMLPALMSLMGGGGLGSAGAGGFTTNYGASASYAPRHPGGSGTGGIPGVEGLGQPAGQTPGNPNGVGPGGVQLQNNKPVGPYRPQPQPWNQQQHPMGII